MSKCLLILTLTLLILPSIHPLAPLPPSTRRVFLSTPLFLPFVPLVTNARPEPVNRPDLLPPTPDQPIIVQDPRITKGQTKRLSTLIKAVEEKSGVRIRILTQSYPITPGLAIQDYWKLGSEHGGDDNYVVLVADDFGGKGNLLNFNVGPDVDLAVPPAFFSRLSGKYGSIFFVRDNGQDEAICQAVEELSRCLVGEGSCQPVQMRKVRMERSCRQRSDSESIIPPSYVTNNLPLVTSLLASPHSK